MSRDTEPCLFCNKVYFSSDLKWINDKPICKSCFDDYLDRTIFRGVYAISEAYPTKIMNLRILNNLEELGYKLVTATTFTFIFIKNENR